MSDEWEYFFGSEANAAGYKRQEGDEYELLVGSWGVILISELPFEPSVRYRRPKREAKELKHPHPYPCSNPNCTYRPEQKWVSVKERLMEKGVPVWTIRNGEILAWAKGIQKPEELADDVLWMPAQIPAPPSPPKSECDLALEHLAFTCSDEVKREAFRVAWPMTGNTLREMLKVLRNLADAPTEERKVIADRQAVELMDRLERVFGKQ